MNVGTYFEKKSLFFQNLSLFCAFTSIHLNSFAAPTVCLEGVAGDLIVLPLEVGEESQWVECSLLTGFCFSTPEMPVIEPSV